MAKLSQLSRREPQDRGHSAVRALLRILEDKGHVRHEYDGSRFMFTPSLSRLPAQAAALKQALRTFFDGSASQALGALLDLSKKDLSEKELDKLSKLLEKARKEGR